MNSEVRVEQCRTNNLGLGKGRSRNQTQVGIIHRDCWSATVRTGKIMWDCITELTEHPRSLASPYLFPTLAMSTESLLSKRTGSQQLSEEIEEAHTYHVTPYSIHFPG